MDEQEIKKIIGRRIKKLREKSGWSQTELSKKLGKEANSVSSYESGNRTLRVTDLPQLASLFDVSIAYLFGEDESVEDVITVVRQLNRANRRVILSFAEELLESQGENISQLLTIERDFGDGKPMVMQILSDSTEVEINKLLKEGWKIIDPKEE